MRRLLVRPNAARLAALATLLVASPLAAQVRTCGGVGLPDCPPGRFAIGAALEVAQPLDEFKEHAGVAAGANLFGTVLVTPGSPLGLIVSGGFISYGREQEEFRLFYGGFPVDLRLQTSNTYVHFGAGPEIAARTGVLRPYIGGTVGVGHFGTSQSLQQYVQRSDGSEGWQEQWSESLQGDNVLALAGLGGLRIAFGGLRAPLTIDVGARYVHNGEAEYVEKGNVTQDANGDYTVVVTRSRADFIAYQLGVSYLFGRR